MRNIGAVLFDADGVVQRPGSSFWEMAANASPDGDSKTFFAAVGAAEKPCLTGHADFKVALAGALEALGSEFDFERALATWCDIEIDHLVIELILALRASGTLCCLATNQNPYRAEYMSAALKLDERFDQVFYSCQVGFAKPDEQYFESVVTSLNIPPHQILFIDDSMANIEAARGLGINAEHFEPYSGGESLQKILDRYSL